MPAIAVSEDKKESVFGILDDLLSHLNRTKKLFMALVISSFIVAPLAIILSILIFTPPFLAGVGQPQDVVFTAKGAMVESFAAGRPVPGDPAAMVVKIVPGEDMKQLNVTGLR